MSTRRVCRAQRAATLLPAWGPSPPAQVHVHDVRGEPLPDAGFSLGAEAEAEGVQAAIVFRDGVAGLTHGGHLW